MRRLARRLWRDEGGQVTTEYMLMLAVAVFLFLAVARLLVGPKLAQLKVAIESALEKRLFRPANFHRFKL